MVLRDLDKFEHRTLMVLGFNCAAIGDVLLHKKKLLAVMINCVFGTVFAGKLQFAFTIKVFVISGIQP